MRQPELGTIAFSRPGGQPSGAKVVRPIDLEHLARQTQGDRAIEQEVLSLFAHQAAIARDKITEADVTARASLAHSLNGSARAVGAFALADCAAEIERDPASRGAVKRLRTLIDEAREFISAISR